MSYTERSELTATVKKNKTALKPHPLLVINKEHHLNYFALTRTCFKWRFFIFSENKTRWQ